MVEIDCRSKCLYFNVLTIVLEDGRNVSEMFLNDSEMFLNDLETFLNLSDHFLSV